MATKFLDRGGGEPADTQLVELAVGGQHRQLGVPVPGAQPGEQPRVLVQAGVQGGAVGDAQGAGQRQPHHGAVLVGQLVEVDVQVGDVAAGVDLAVQGQEPPPADVAGVDADRAVRLVEVDEKHVAGVGFDVVEVGDFRCAGVPDPPGGADLGAGMLVAQRNIVQGAAGQRVLDRGQPDQRRFARVGVQHVDAAVGDQDPGGAVGGQPVQHRRDQIGGGRLGVPRRGDEFHARPQGVHAGPVQHHDVVGAFGGEQGTGVDR
ncbi:hypothetical protein C1Y40_01200 [Mycobacterium talmoniae]|uniref:Uncharacterized protein n=1 Tax=Mycobacterium talmoniae TaxID=1858794 RepID=A0A2S8BPI6_9MYCO|nr:hypothetical protein C1Y40_01200 [Mycobacterium talmoniae]